MHLKNVYFNSKKICTEEFIKERDLYRRSIIEDVK